MIIEGELALHLLGCCRSFVMRPSRKEPLTLASLLNRWHHMAELLDSRMPERNSARPCYTLRRAVPRELRSPRRLVGEIAFRNINIIDQ